MTAPDIFLAQSVTGTGELAVPSAYRPLRNSGSVEQWADLADLLEQIVRCFEDIGRHADPHLEGFEQFTVSHWDGEEAAPIAKEDLDFARKLLERLWALPPERRSSGLRSLLESMARLDPAQALQWANQAGGRYVNTVRTTAAQGLALVEAIAAASVSPMPRVVRTSSWAPSSLSRRASLRLTMDFERPSR